MMSEEWRDLPGHPGYQVSSIGRVQGPKKKPITGYQLKDGRLWSWTGPMGSKLRDYVHSQVLKAFVGPRPEGMECCHNDGDNSNNVLSNLRWDTPKGNQADKNEHGTHNKGSRHGLSKLHECEVREIKRALAHGASQKWLAAVFNVHQSHISDIKRGERWGWLAA